MVRLLVSLSKLLFLCLETLSLINGIVQLRISVRHLPAVHEKLKTLHILRIFRFLLGQRRNLDGMVHYEGRLNEMFLHILLEEQVQNVALLMSLLKCNVMLLRQRSRLLQSLHLIPVHTGILLHRIHHCDTLKRFSKIHLDSVIDNLRGSQNLLGNMAVKILCQVHHSIIIRIRLIQFHQRKFRIMSRIQSLVAEYPADLIDSLQASDNQTFQIQFQRNAQLQVFVQSVKMRLKRSCRRSACVCHQHRSLDFHKALAVQIFADRADDFRTLDKSILYLRIHDQIHVSLAVTKVCVRQPVELLREDLKALAQKRQAGYMDGNLAGFRLKHRTLHTHDIADIHFLEVFVGFLADIVARHVALNAALKVLYIAEGSFSHHTF